MSPRRMPGVCLKDYSKINRIMEEKKNSPFYTALIEALDKAVPLRSDDDVVLCIVSDNHSISRLSGGNYDILARILFSYMMDNPALASAVCNAVHNYMDILIHSVMPGVPALKVSPPPVPEGGIGQWPNGSPVILQRSVEEAKKNNVSPNNDKQQ